MLDTEGVEFTISVPFERFTVLKAVIENRKRWRRLNGQWSFFESNSKASSWIRSGSFNREAGYKTATFP